MESSALVMEMLYPAAMMLGMLTSMCGGYLVGYGRGRVEQYAKPDRPLPEWAKRHCRGYLEKHQAAGKRAE